VLHWFFRGGFLEAHRVINYNELNLIDL
jgi:hypothetical protein